MLAAKLQQIAGPGLEEGLQRMMTLERAINKEVAIMKMIMMPQWRKLITFVLREVVTDVEGFPGGPHDTLVLRDFENHVALRVCNGDVCKS